MKKRRSIWILSLTGILLLLSGIILGRGLIEECLLQNGDYALQKVQVSVKNQLDRQSVNSFSVEDIDKLKKELSTKDISYTAKSGLLNTPVTLDGRIVSVKLTGADHIFPKFHKVPLMAGSFITEKQEEERARVAVIDHRLAWELFKTDAVTGKNMEIYGSTFTIIGVMKEDKSLIGYLTDSGLPEVYIPAEVMLELDETAGITDLQVRTETAGTLDQNSSRISAALQKTGKNPANYNLIDYNLKLALIKQIPLLLVFIPGIAAAFLLLIHVKNQVMRIYILISEGCRMDYFSHTVRSNIRTLGACLAEMAAALAGIILIWKGISFTPYIPPQYIPDELINLTYYRGLIEGLIQGGIQNMGYIAPEAELIMNTVSTLLTLLFFISAVLGLLLVHIAFKDIKASGSSVSSLTVKLGLVFITALAAAAGVASLAVLPFTPDIKSLLVVWAFIYANILFNNNQERIVKQKC